ncbi:hypothetical protein [Sediminicola luteus]|uniref:DUF559 domain-containing protein n=1 Tax=Sediminicola luteus TaxID=319238 RepID=A0A2A4G8F4_9FLAO|nr:hypothetical protein [Sediminicola luteus]PCE64035.1 hypothetical protein B7P33_12375 [Sediminicola luteus]
MTCIECKKSLSREEQEVSVHSYGVALCNRHQNRLQKLKEHNNTPMEAIQLYYGLKREGLNPMLEWYDGKRHVDIALSRVKLNIEIDTDYRTITHEQAMRDLEDASNSFKNGFTTLRIPHILVRCYLEDTIKNIMDIVAGLKKNIKAIGH